MFAHTHPIIFAHRGDSAHAPENTLAAFHLGLEQGADAIELDAKLSADGVVVVMHDATVDRTTDGKGAVNQLLLSALKELDAGVRFNGKYHGERIPTLDEVFERFRRRAIINVELTNYTSPQDALPEKVAYLVLKYNIQEFVLFSSFNPQTLRHIQRLLPSVAVGLLALPGWAGILARSWFGNALCHYQALHPAVSDVTPNLVKQQHRTGHLVHVYTVNDPKDMQRLFAMNVDGIFTDDPALARNILELNKPNLKEETGHVC